MGHPGALLGGRTDPDLEQGPAPGAASGVQALPLVGWVSGGRTEGWARAVVASLSDRTDHRLVTAGLEAGCGPVETGLAAIGFARTDKPSPGPLPGLSQVAFPRLLSFWELGGDLQHDFESP